MLPAGGALVEQPPEVEIRLVQGLFVKQMFLASAGMTVPQHSHAYEHLTMLAWGEVAVWRDGAFLGKFRAPTGIRIAADAKHLIQALVDGTVLYCIHRVGPDGEPEIAEEHHVAEGA